MNVNNYENLELIESIFNNIKKGLLIFPLYFIGLGSNTLFRDGVIKGTIIMMHKGIGDISQEKVKILQEVDAIFIKGLKDNNLYEKVWQAGAILLNVKSVGVMGDERTYEECVALRAVESTDGMTADWVNLPYEFLQNISNKIINNVKGVNRVVYDISSKPPATIEWE